jgi:hypothetical protein
MTRREHKLGTCWLVRLLRGLRPDRNPLRRRSDRAEAVVLAALLAAFLAVTMARWRAPDGQARSGEVFATARGSKARWSGTEVPCGW